MSYDGLAKQIMWTYWLDGIDLTWEEALDMAHDAEMRSRYEAIQTWRKKMDRLLSASAKAIRELRAK